MRLRLIYVSPTSAVGYPRVHTFVCTVTLFCPSANDIYSVLPTMASADFSQFVVTTADLSACETSRDKPVFFPRLPSQFTHMGYGYLSGFTISSQLTRHIRLIIRFLSVGLRFRYLFFSPVPHDTNLESRYKVRW